MTLKNIIAISLFFLSIHSFAAQLVTCEDKKGNSLAYSTSSISGAPTLYVRTLDQSLDFHGTDQISILQYHPGSYYIDAADRDHGIRYDNVQFEVLNQNQFNTTLSIAKVDGCTRTTTDFHLHCTSKEVVF